jgi:hypothetical protein
MSIASRCSALWKVQKISLSDILSSTATTVTCCICFFVLIDAIAFPDLDPITFGDRNCSLFPSYSHNRQFASVQIDGLTRFTHFVRVEVTIDPNSSERSDVTSLIAIVFRENGHIVDRRLISTNITAQPLEVVCLRALSFDSVSVKIDSQGDFSENSYANVHFDFGSSLFFYRRLLIRASFFSVSLSFLVVFCRKCLELRGIPKIMLVVMSACAANRFMLFLNSEVAALANASIRRLFLGTTTLIAALRNFIIPEMGWSKAKLLVVFGILALFYCTDLGLGLAIDCGLARRLFQNLAASGSLGTLEWGRFALLTIEMLAMPFSAFLLGHIRILRLIVFFFQCMNDVVVLMNTRDGERGFLSIVGMAIPNIFAYDYIAAPSDEGIELADANLPEAQTGELVEHPDPLVT